MNNSVLIPVVVANEPGTVQTYAVKPAKVTLRSSGGKVKGVSRCSVGVVSPCVHVLQREMCCIVSRKISWKAEPKKVIVLYSKGADARMARVLEYGGARETLSESAETIR